jgi:hypothetical protein
MYLLLNDGYRKFEFRWINAVESGYKPSICMCGNDMRFYHLDSDLVLTPIRKQNSGRQIHPYEISTLDKELYESEGIISFWMSYSYAEKWEYTITLYKSGIWYAKLRN